MTNLKTKSVASFPFMSIKKRFSVVYIALLFGLTLMMVAMALPGYFKGHWAWEKAPSVSSYEQLLKLRQTGISLPGWQSIAQKEVRLDNAKWSAQVFINDQEQEMSLLLLPQGVEKEKPHLVWSRPYVEWTGIDGLERWKKDRVRIITVETENNSKVEARFFKAWNSRTFIVLQWYAWPSGGKTHSSDWFWRDQMTQFKGKRLPWVAVNVKILIDPLSNLEDQEALAKSVVQKVQNALETEVFAER